jgi:predicted P-loop ATPase
MANIHFFSPYLGVGHQSVSSQTFERTAQGDVKRTFKNAVIALTELGIDARRNTFSDKIILSNSAGKSVLSDEHQGLLSDNALSLIRHRIQDQLGFDPGKDHLIDGIKAMAEDARFNPVDKWLGSLGWDGTPRVNDWLTKYIGAPATPLSSAVGRAILCSMVMRARHPGSKADLCPVFEGDQGCGKSSLIRALASGPGESYFCDAPGLIAMDNKARAELLAGKWVVELAELSGLAKSEIEGVKAFLSQSTDQYRPAYGTVAVDRPRTCIFIASTNAETYLPDASGNRRFVPVPCKKVDLDGFVSVRDQLFAEAVHIFKATVGTGTPIKSAHPLPHSLSVKCGLDATYWNAAAALADTRRLTDPVEDVLPDVVADLEKSAEVLPSGQTFITSSTLLSSLRLRLHGPVRNNGLATWMKALGWSAAKKGSGSQQVRGYIK